ncbi:MAG: MarR family transcriptional regulator, partial [Allomuricauda sp.]
MKDLTIDHALRATWQAVSKMYNEEAKNYDLTMAIGFTLLSIDPKGGTPSTTLGPKMGMEATSLSRILKTIEERGYIERKPNPNDGRGVLIYLTPLG